MSPCAKQVRRPRTHSHLAASLREEDGQSTVFVALMLATFLLGFVALAVDASNLFHQRRKIQAAADAAAVAAAEETAYGSAAENAAAAAMAKLNGFDTTLAKNPAAVSVGAPTSGSYKNSASYIQVIVSKPVATYFAGAIKLGPTFTVSGRAVSAAGLTSPTCVCLTGQSGTDLNMSNNAKLTASGCGITIDSNSAGAVTVVGSATVTAMSIGSVSTGWNNSTYINNAGKIASGTDIVLGITNQCSPPAPTTPAYTAAQCTADPLTHYGNGGSSYSVGPGSTYSTTQSGNTVCYNSLTVGSNGDAVNLNPGIYVINGGSLHFLSGANNASNTGGNGVFFYLVGNASLTIDNGANVNLTAMTSGTYAGTLVYQDIHDTQTMSVQGGSNTSFNGSILAPSAALTLGNGSGTAIDADVTAKSLTMNGGGTLNSTATANFGTLNISTAKLGE